MFVILPATQLEEGARGVQGKRTSSALQRTRKMEKHGQFYIEGIDSRWMDEVAKFEMGSS